MKSPAVEGGALTLSRGSVVSFDAAIAQGDTLGNPFHHFAVTPRDPTSAKLNPSGKLAAVFEPSDVLEAVRNAKLS
jgi:hypothetical protein